MTPRRILVLGWVVFLVYAYPGYMSYDSVVQLLIHSRERTFFTYARKSTVSTAPVAVLKTRIEAGGVVCDVWLLHGEAAAMAGGMAMEARPLVLTSTVSRPATRRR